MFKNPALGHGLHSDHLTPTTAMKQLQLEIPGTESLGPLFEQEEIRGLSFWQPFGTLMFYDKVETRTWSTPYRGLVLICTTKTPLHKQSLEKSRHIIITDEHHEQIDKAFENESFFAPTQPTIHLNGFAIGVGRLVDCRRVKEGDRTYCVASPDVWGHVYADVKRIKPFAVKGGQGWFKVTPDMRAQIQLV